MDQTQNSEAMSPDMAMTQRPSTSALMGDIFRALTEHGLGLEQQVDSLRNGNRALQYAQKHTEEMLGKAQQTVDSQAKRLGSLEAGMKERAALLHEMWALICNSTPADPAFGDEWTKRKAELRDQYHATLPALLPPFEPAQTDAEPTEGVDPTCTKAGHLTSSCGHAPDAEGVVHSHGQHKPHVHSHDDYEQHQRPIDQEQLLPPFAAAG